MFNWLFAQQHHGQFILRIEDTDRQRFVPGAMEKIIDALNWYGLVPDEGPKNGGPFGPYIQSQRLEIYCHHVDELLKHDQAYYCFCTPQRLAELRAKQMADKKPTKYDKRCAIISYSQAKARLRAGESAVVRMRLPDLGEVKLTDIIRGTVTFKYELQDDSVILKTDGYPTYHLANVVDDHLMGISHVIRAEEWLSSVPKHIFLYQAFKWTIPQFAHLPLLLGHDRSKLSKRHGAVSALSFRDQGYLPEAMINFLLLMGWHPKSNQEIISRTQAIKDFTWTGFNPAGAVFDQTKLNWFNGWYIRHLSDQEFIRSLKPFWKLPSSDISAQRLTAAANLVRDRLSKFGEINELINYIFPSVWDKEIPSFDRQLIIYKSGTVSNASAALAWAGKWLAKYRGPWQAAKLKTLMLKDIVKDKKNNGDILWPVRVALTLRRASPDVFDLLAYLGSAESQRRIDHVRTTIALTNSQ